MQCPDAGDNTPEWLNHKYEDDQSDGYDEEPEPEDIHLSEGYIPHKGTPLKNVDDFLIYIFWLWKGK